MIRKLVLALGAVAILGATVLAPTAASAKGKKGWHPHFGIVVANPAFYADDDCPVIEKTYFRHGRWHTRLVQVCD